MIAVVGVRGMSLVRRATTEDAEEVLRLRQVMIDALPDGDSSTEWHAEALPGLRARLGEADGDFAAFVVDHPDRPGALAAPGASLGVPRHAVGHLRHHRGWSRSSPRPLRALPNRSPYPSLTFAGNTDPSMQPYPCAA